MAEKKTFRTAFNGFNREDVVHYIEYMNAKHQSEINQHLSEADFLRRQLAQARNSTAPAPADPAELTQALQRVAELEAQLQAALAEKDAAIAEKNAALAGKEAALTAAAKAEADRDEAKNQQSTAQCRVEQELEAYRRAERMEREARERSQKVYHQVNGVLADATVRVDEAAGQIGALTDQVMNQLKALQDAAAGSKQALQDAAQTMYALRPTEDEE